MGMAALDPARPKGGALCLLPLLRLLPLRQEGKAFGLVEILQERLVDRNRPRLVADQLRNTLDRRLAINV